jgi:acid phosphatase type 7
VIRSIKILIVAALGVTLGVATQAAPLSSAATTLVRQPTADATVDEKRPDRRSGTSETLLVDDDHGNGTDYWSYLRFDIGSPPGEIDGARLRLYVVDQSSRRPTVALASNSWSETTIAWENRPAPTGAVIRPAGDAPTGAWIDLDVSQLVPSSGQFTLVLRLDSTNGVDMSSRSGDHPPELVLDVGGSPTSTSPPPTGPPSSDPRIAAVGDIACDPSSGSFNGGVGTATSCHQMAVSQLVVDGGYAAFLGLGDLQYESGTYDDFMASYHPSFGRVKSISRPVPGNHEYQTGGAAGYYQYFGASAGDPAKGYYSYDVGEWHIVALNSNCDVVSCAAGSVQERWLRADLAANPARCTLVYWHHPLFSSGGEHGNNPGMAALYQAADDGGVDVALAGHDHHYERFARQDAAARPDPNGIRQFVVGSGGKNHYSMGTLQQNSEAHNNDTYGVLALTLHADSYDWKFVAEAGGRYNDSGTQACQ